VIKADTMQNDFPSSWELVQIGDICSTTSGGTPSRKTNKYYEGAIPWVKSGELNDGLVSDIEEHITDEAIAKSSAKIFPSGTLLIALYGATVGKLGILTKDAATNQAVCAIFPPENVKQKYLFWYLRYIRSDLIASAIGGAQPNISQGIIKDTYVPIASENEQKRIVAEIEKQFSRLDEAVENLKRVKANLKRYKASVLKAAVEGKLTEEWRKVNKDKIEPASVLFEKIKAEREKQYKDSCEKAKKEGKTKPKKPKKLKPIDKKSLPELPEWWEWGQINEITSVLGDGLHGTPIYSDEGDYYFINGNNLSDGIIEIKGNTKRVTIEEYDKYKKPLSENTVLVSINGTLGNTAFYNGEKVILGKSACYFNVLNIIDKHYIRYCITSPQFTNYAYKNATGSTIKNVSLKAMREFAVPIPTTFEEQQAIVAQIESRLSVADNLEKEVEANLKRADRLRQSILKRAFSGLLG